MLLLERYLNVKGRLSTAVVFKFAYSNAAHTLAGEE